MLDKKQLALLKSGTDVRGTAVETADEPVQLTDEVVYGVTNAFIYWLSARLNKENLKIAVGHDSRISADRLKAQVMRALKNSGVTAYDCGLSTTPSMFMMTQFEDTAVHGAVMITASHHPFNKNGLKFFTAAGGLDSEDIVKILDFAALGLALTGKGKSHKVIRQNYMDTYAAHLVNTVQSGTGELLPLHGLHIVVDAGNGAAGFFEGVLKRLGADTTGSQFLDPDGMFPNHQPNPENAEAMRSISACVLRNNADFGVIFDTDGDRAACVSSDGTEINRNRLIALMSAIILKDSPSATIVTDSVTSDGLSAFITALNGDHHRFKRGYKNVINEAVELNNMGVDAPLAIETSGHAAFRENYFLDDGAYLVTKILIELCLQRRQKQDLLALIADLKQPKEEAEIRLGFKTDDFTEYGNSIVEALKKNLAARPGFKPAAVNYEGVRVGVKDGFFLVRMSVHDPIMAINIESDVAGGVLRTAKNLRRILRPYKYLDTTGIKTFISEKKAERRKKQD